MHIVYVTDGTIPDPFAGKADVLAGVPEVAELSSDAGLARCFGYNAGFVNGAAKRFFAIEVLFLIDDGKRNHGVRMVRRCEQDGIDVFSI